MKGHLRGSLRMFWLPLFLEIQLSNSAITTVFLLKLVDCVGKKKISRPISNHKLCQGPFLFLCMCPKQIKLHSTVYHKQMFFS